MKDAGARLLDNPRYQELIRGQPQYLIDGDLWPENILLQEFGEEILVHVLDLDPVLLGPSILQPAILFSSCFLVSFLLDHRARKPDFDIDELISIWPEPLDKHDLLIMMQVFPIALSLQKELNTDHHSEGYQQSLDLYTQCLAFIQSLLK